MYGLRCKDVRCLITFSIFDSAEITCQFHISTISKTRESSEFYYYNLKEKLDTENRRVDREPQSNW